MCSQSFISLTVAITTDMPNSSIQILLMPAKLVDVAGILAAGPSAEDINYKTRIEICVVSACASSSLNPLSGVVGRTWGICIDSRMSKKEP